MTSYNLNTKLLLLTKILLIYLFFLSKSFSIENNQLKAFIEGNENAKIEILVYESLTCPHCATFHNEVYPNLKKKFIDKGLVKIEQFFYWVKVLSLIHRRYYFYLMPDSTLRIPQAHHLSFRSK